jgi:signal transduction histidine kinase
MSPELLVIGGQTVVAALITIALLWYARLFRETERRAHQIQAINDIALTINTSLDLAESFQAVTKGTRRLMAFNRASIALLNDAGDTFEVVASTADLPGSELEHDPLTVGGPVLARIQRANSAAARVIAQREVWISKSLTEEQHRPDAGILWGEDARWCIALPLSLRGEAIGVFTLSGNQRFDLDEDTIEALQLITEQIAIATANAKLFAETRAFARELEQRVEERTRELRETQEQMMRSEKLAVAGQLAAAMAHEINNPLQSIRLYLELIADRQNPDAISEGYLEVAQDQVDRISGIVSRLLQQLYQPTEEPLTPVDLNAVLQDLVALFDRQLAEHGIALMLALSDAVPPVIGANNALRQVCLNVLLNAVEAMPDGGTLLVQSELTTRETVRLTFQDSGVGIAPDALFRITDPFYTTKPHGTGLGLSVSDRIVHKHGGAIRFESEPNCGTTVRIELPVTDHADSGDETQPATSQENRA